MKVCIQCLRRWMVVDKTYFCYCVRSSYVYLQGDDWEEEE